MTVDGKQYEIRTDYRDILTILSAFEDVELSDAERLYICLYILYKDFDEIPQNDYEEAYREAEQFIDCGMTRSDNKARTMDWEQDEALLFPAVNKVAGFEVRSVDYLHWWTFMGYFMEITDGVFSHVLSLRQKKAKNKKLEKWEQEFWNANRDMCVLKKRRTSEEQAEIDRINAMLG